MSHCINYFEKLQYVHGSQYQLMNTMLYHAVSGGLLFKHDHELCLL
uniref:Uncharacterized protein n=1 Tax=Rhizophora mucronata TaxID=61149 RepID=A0A2P2PKB3_RHIMU